MELDLKAEAILAPNISFNNPLSDNINCPQSIFLTGGTGFLGAYLLKELLSQTTADIYCLIRCHHVELAQEQFKKLMQFYGLWQEDFNSRIIPIIGDLSQPFLGLSQKQFNQLAEKIDIIYHNGSQNDPITPYFQIKGTNVLGTQEILRLASLTQTKPVHFISTVAIFFNRVYAKVERVLETDFPLADAGLNTGYQQSKWVAESLIYQAQERGLPACIYRPTRILGDSKTGIYGKFNNFFLQFIKVCIQSKTFPAFEVDTNFIPVDYGSQAIIYLSRQQQSLGKTFHLVNPQSISWQKLFELINACGYLSIETSEDKWFVAVENCIFESVGEKAVNSLLPTLVKSAKIINSRKPDFDHTQTMTGLANSLILCPPIDLPLIRTYFSYFYPIISKESLSWP